MAFNKDKVIKDNNKNWLSQSGNKNFSDSDFQDMGIPTGYDGEEGLNRRALDIVHAQNVEGYMSLGFTEQEAKKMADKKRSEAIQGAKANGLTMTG